MKKEERIKFIISHPEMSYSELAPHLGYKGAESVRDFCKNNKLPNKKNNSQSQRSGEDLATMITKVISKKRLSAVELADMFNVSPRRIFEAVEELKKKNIAVDNFNNGGLQLAVDIKPIEEPFRIQLSKHKEKEFPIGFVTDNHVGSKYERLDVLNALYDRFKSYGVETVYQGGNIIDGECRFNKFDIYAHGVDSQVKNLIEKYPVREGIKTYFITGDDHEGWFVQREHVNIGQMIEDEAKRNGRNDLIFIGHMERDIEYKQAKGSSIIRVIHAGGGSAYAVSYTSQKYVESLQGGEKPQIVLVGH